MAVGINRRGVRVRRGDVDAIDTDHEAGRGGDIVLEVENDIDIAIGMIRHQHGREAGVEMLIDVGGDTEVEVQMSDAQGGMNGHRGGMIGGHEMSEMGVKITGTGVTQIDKDEEVDRLRVTEGETVGDLEVMH